MSTKNDTEKPNKITESAVKAEIEFNSPAQELQTAINTQTPAVVESQSEQVMNALVTQINSGTLAPEQLGMVLDAQERVLDRQAREIYGSDMSHCQGEIPSVLKNKFNQQTQSKFEDLESLNIAIKPVYTKWGFAVSFNTGQSAEGWLKTTAKVTHRAGWSETFENELPLDGTGIKGAINKTGVHAVASSRSYARRYLLKDIFNLTTSDDIDDDGNAAGQNEVERMGAEINRLNKIGKAIIDHCGEISTIKYGIEIEMLADAAETWFKLTDDEKKSLWIAPTKGGAFTTKEREVIKSSEFRKAFYGEDGDKNEK